MEMVEKESLSSYFYKTEVQPETMCSNSQKSIQIKLKG